MERAALSKKQNAKGVVVVLDAYHFTALVGRTLVQAYLAAYPNPADEFKFKDAWITGSTGLLLSDRVAAQGWPGEGNRLRWLKNASSRHYFAPGRAFSFRLNNPTYLEFIQR